jgi:RNA polymerase sigma-70 factor (ECF subfamily)
MADRDRLAESRPDNPSSLATQAPPDAALAAALRGAQRGDEDGFRHLYRATQPELLKCVRALVGEVDAEDVTSEAWSRIVRDLRGFRGDTGGFRRWAVTIARHRAVDHLRRQHSHVSLSQMEGLSPAAHDDVERDVVESMISASALAMVAKLPREQGQAILLRVVLGFDAATAGQVLGKRPGAIRTATYRGLRTLAHRFAAGGLEPRWAATRS